MRLRTRLLLLFAAFAVLPLSTIGALGYVRARGTLESLVASRTAVQVDRMARAFGHRVERLESDLALFGGNAATVAWLVARARGDATTERRTRTEHEQYLEELWAAIGSGYDRGLLRDSDGEVVAELLHGSRGEDAATDEGTSVPVERRVAGPGGASLGSVILWPRIEDLVRDVGLGETFGDRGRNMVVDRGSGRILALGGSDRTATAIPSLPESSDGASAAVGYVEGGERMLASFVQFESPPWTLVSTASADEFAGPILRQRIVDLFMVLAVIVGASIAFYLMLRSATRSLDQLAGAALRVGAGDLSPPLPPDGVDEVGQLAAAFRVMTRRLGESLAQIEAERQTALLGRFAVELAHEIRNPLTSVKLSLQALEREGREGRLTSDGEEGVSLALREIQRIDQALSAALRTGRPPAPPGSFSVHATLVEAVHLLRAEADAGDVRVDVRADARDDRCRGDAGALRGVFVNLILNALQAMDGSGRKPGTVGVVTATTAMEGGAPAIEVRIRDEGGGVPPELRERVFHPFFTTREAGTGLGLSVALQSVRAMGGSLRFADADGPGAEVVVTLPLHPFELSP